MYTISGRLEANVRRQEPSGFPTNTKKEHYSQAEIDHLFISIVLPNFSYALSVYGQGFQ